jgi:hypothetical protein
VPPQIALPEGLGWFIVCGLGALFSIFTAGLVRMRRGTRASALRPACTLQPSRG